MNSDELPMITLADASHLASVALDELVAELLRSKLHVPESFRDWVVDEGSMLVDVALERAFANERFVASLLVGEDTMIAMRRWVRHWVGPHIVTRFDALAIAFPEFQPLPRKARRPRG